MYADSFGIMSRVRSLLFDLEHIDLCILHVPDAPTSIPIPLPLIASNRNVAIPTSLQTSLVRYSIRDWCRHKTITMQNTVSLPSVDTQASMIDSFSPRYMVCWYDPDPRSRRLVAHRAIRDHSQASIIDSFSPDPCAGLILVLIRGD